MALQYNEYSESIRQMPENYLIAHRHNGVWLCQPDLACNQRIAVKVFKLLFKHDVKYGPVGVLLAHLGLEE